MSGVRSLVIGTAADCDLRVAEGFYASPRHCQVMRRDDGAFWVADLGSTNGTWLEVGEVMMVPWLPISSMRRRVVGGTRWPAGWVLWVGRAGLELDRRGWVRPLARRQGMP